MKGVTNSSQSGLEGGAKSKNFDFRTFGGGASLYLFKMRKEGGRIKRQSLHDQ
jgi:hypothetical protein